MPLTKQRQEGEFSQVSNIVQVTTADAPTTITQILVGMMDGETFLLNQDLSEMVAGGTVDPHLGYQNGYEVNAGGSIIGSYGAYLEASSAGASKSDDGGETYVFNGAPIYTNAPVHASRVAYGGDGGDRYFLHMGTRSAGQPSCAWSDVFGNDGFTWNAISISLFQTVPTSGFAGVDAIPVDSAVDDGNTLFCAYTHDGQVYAGDGKNGMILYGVGGPSIAFNDSTSVPYARFAGQGFGDNDVIVGMYAGRIVVTVNGSETWDMTTYNDAFTDTNIIGGAGFNSPAMFGLAYGGGVWVACGNAFAGEAGVIPQIRISSVGAETPWTSVEIPVGLSQGFIDFVYDVVYDKAGARFLMLARERWDDSLTETTHFYATVLQSVDGGQTWTAENSQEYVGQDLDRGWIKVFEVEPPSFDLLQEDGSAVLQEDGSFILVSNVADVPPVFTLEPSGVNESMSWTAAVPGVGTLTGYEIWRTSAQEFEGQTNFSNPSAVTVDDLLTLLGTVDVNTLSFLDTTADNTTVQYAYNVRATMTGESPGFIDSNIEFSSQVS